MVSYSTTRISVMNHTDTYIDRALSLGTSNSSSGGLNPRPSSTSDQTTPSSGLGINLDNSILQDRIGSMLDMPTSFDWVGWLEYLINEPS
jgi:hypothetical protein